MGAGQATGQLGEVRPPSLITSGIGTERAGVHVELPGEMEEQPRWGNLIRFQDTAGMARTDQHQGKSELASLPASPGDKFQIFRTECRVTEHLALVCGKAKQSCLCRFAQQPSSCHRAVSRLRRVARPALPANRHFMAEVGLIRNPGSSPAARAGRDD